MADKKQDKQVAVVEDGKAPVSPVVMAPILGPADAFTQSARIEGARAIAEVQASYLIAQAHPRSEGDAEQRMRRTCSRRATAENAWYSYKRGGKQIIGLRVTILRELLRCWGNAMSGMTELQRLPGRSEMQAWAVDLETNYVARITFWWDHLLERGEESGGDRDYAGNREIYEGTMGAAGRREREMIRRILPDWFIATAEAELHGALAGEPEELPGRIEKVVSGFKALGVSQKALEERVVAPRTAWGWNDVNTLEVIYKSIRQRETTLAEEFPGLMAKGSAADTLAQAAAAQGKTEPSPPADPPADPQGSLSPPPSPGERDKAEALDQIASYFAQAKWDGKSGDAIRVRRDVVANLAREDESKDAPVKLPRLSALTVEQAQRVAERMAEGLSEYADGHAWMAGLARDVQDAKAAPPPDAPGGEQ